VTLKDWLTILTPEICVILGLLLTALWAWWSALVPRVTAWLTAHHQTELAQGFAAANAVLQPALQTGANAILDKIRTGQIDLSDKASIEAEAQREVDLVKARVPDMVALAAPAANALVASMVGKVQAGAITLPVPANDIASPIDAILQAKALLTAATTAIALPAPPAPAPSTLLDASGTPVQPAAAAA
jgi:hypothetical protein